MRYVLIEYHWVNVISINAWFIKVEEGHSFLERDKFQTFAFSGTY